MTTETSGGPGLITGGGPAPDRRVLTYGASAVLVECADAAEALAVAHAVRDDQEVAETVPGARTVLIRCRHTVSRRLRQRLAVLPVVPADRLTAPIVEVPVRYDGPDLVEAARACGLTPTELIEVHTAAAWQVAFCGFAPGFGYLEAAGDPLPVPRRAAPRPRVPAGSVGLADRWSGIYPRQAPGGWQLIGHTRVAVWDPAQQPPALLSPGTRVRFVVADQP